ncbi:enoyl-CoA hydratase/isomerase family protein [Novosphingobium sp.]|uniref:enoyl-CoA hydratase/isomerase family protein n=1 Tax=Novosphingobium sp. TaxID=1874826 RepID=UPI00286DA1E1|nr:enoyl-CoA hydratase/isomerase family protein [Novosphingobium sp.]
MPDSTCLIVENCFDSGFDSGERLPACPIVAIGESRSGALDWADVVVADRLAADRIAAHVQANPNAAQVIVGLLRELPKLSLADGLERESLTYGVLQAGDEFQSWLENRAPVEASAPGKVCAERVDDTLHLQLDRPEAGNAIDVSMRDGLSEMLQLAVIDTSIRRIVLTGAGRSFSLGADLAEFGTTRDPAEAHAIRQQTLPAHWAARCGDRMEVRVQGACVGAGLELAAFAGRIIAGPRAWFQLPELAMGLLPGAGGCVSLTRRIGRHRTAELILSGRRLNAREALAWGLVDELAADEGGANKV